MRKLRKGRIIKTVSLEDNTKPLYGMILSEEGLIVFPDGKTRRPEATQAHLDLIRGVSLPENADPHLEDLISDAAFCLGESQKAIAAAEKKKTNAKILLAEASKLEAEARRQYNQAFEHFSKVALSLQKLDDMKELNLQLQKERDACTGDETFEMSFYDGTLNVLRAAAVIEKTERPIYYRYGFSYRGAEKCPVSKQGAINYMMRKGSLTDVSAKKDEIIVNQYSSNDMF